MNFRELEQKYHAWEARTANQININKRFPGYWNNTVMRGGFFIVAVLLFLSLWLGGFTFKDHVYVKCPDDTYGPCVNPYYGLCSEDICTPEYLYPGQVLGDVPNEKALSLQTWASLVLVGTFLLNHGLYLLWGRKQ